MEFYTSAKSTFPLKPLMEIPDQLESKSSSFFNTAANVLLGHFTIWSLDGAQEIKFMFEIVFPVFV